LVTPDQNGLLVPTGDAPALARALEVLLANPERLLAMGQQARERVVTRFSLQVEADGIGAVYQRLWATAAP